MDSLYILIPVGVILIGIAVAVFLWAVNNHQFDDLDSEGQRLLFSRDDADPPATTAPDSADSIPTDTADPDTESRSRDR